MDRILEDEHDDRRARELIAWIEATAGASCSRCSNALCAHELLLASALGHKRAPICGTCAARELGTPDVRELGEHLLGHFRHRACYGAAWSHAIDREPDCPLSSLGRGGQPMTSAVRHELPSTLAHETWDAGDLGCGDLVLELRLRMRALRTGEVLELFARDPGAGADLPAWCGMTGHEMLDARPPRFLIRRRRD